MEDQKDGSSDAKSKAIGDTLYDREWVESAVIGIVSALEESSSDLDGEAEADLSSLVDMSVEKDVCVYLSESGCLDLLRDRILLRSSEASSSGRACELTLCLVSNSLSVERLFPRLLCDPMNLQAVADPFHRSASAPVLVQTFVALRTFVASLSRLVQSGGGTVSEAAADILKANLLCAPFVGRLSHLLSASSNPELLEAMAKFVFALFETSLDIDAEQLFSSDYAKEDFSSAILEAARQSLDDDTASFHFVEVLGHLASLEEEDQLPEAYFPACEVASAYLESFGGDEEERTLSASAAAVAGKICHACWRHRRHDASFKTLSEVLESLRAFSGGGSEDESVAAVTAKLEQYLAYYHRRYILNS